jgi:hypothetical protein
MSKKAAGPGYERGTFMMIKASQKIFTDQEVSILTGICLEHLHSLARNRRLGSLAQAAQAAGDRASQWLFTHSDLAVLAFLGPRCQH